MSGIFMISTGRMIREHRERAGLTRKELADLASVGKTTVYDIERGKPTVRMDSLLAVLDVLNMKIEIHSPFEENDSIKGDV